MTALNRNLLSKLKSRIAVFPSLMSPVIAIIFIALFSRAEKTKAYDYDEQKNKNYHSVAQDTLHNISDVLLFEQTGNSSWYGNKFHKKKTANGERYDKNLYTAAHKSLPFGSIVKVTNLDNNKSLLVRINDRGPYAKKRVIDLSHRAARELGAFGNPRVKVQTLTLPEKSFKPEENAKKYFFAYSISDDIACLPAENFVVTNSFEDFSSAVEVYHKLIDNNPSQKYYILTFAQEVAGEDGTLLTGTYYIGVKKSDNQASNYLNF